MSAASRIVDLGEPIGRRRFSLVSVPELDELASRFTDCDVYIYAYLSGARTALAAMLMALVPLPDRLGVRLFRNIFRRNRLPVDGFAASHVAGESQGREVRFTAQITYRDRCDYWINALVPATVARLISQSRSASSQANSASSQGNAVRFQANSVRPGLHYLADAVDPLFFVSTLKHSGISQSESFHSLE